MIQIDLSGKRGLVMGVANSRSLGWALAEKLHEAGRDLIALPPVTMVV